MTTKYIDSNQKNSSFLKEYNESKSNQLLADTFHDEINVLKKVQPKKSSFEDNLLEHSTKNGESLASIIESPNFEEFVYADLAGNDSVEIEEKKNSELFVLDVFSGSYQIPGINNFLDCTGPQTGTTIKKKFELYDSNSPTLEYSHKFNCDELLFSYFKRTNVTRIKKSINFETNRLADLSDIYAKQIYKNLINCFWEKLIEIVEFLLKKDEDILQQETYDLNKAIEILKKFEFEFDTDNFKLYLLDNLNLTEKTEWIPTQKLLAREILNLCNSGTGKKKLPTPNVRPGRGKDDEVAANHNIENENKFISVIKSYFLSDDADADADDADKKNNKIKIQILVLSLCKFLGDTSHIVMTYILLSEIKNASTEIDKLSEKMKLSKGEGEESDKVMDVVHDKDALKKLEALKTLKINLQLSERPMLIRNCLPDKDILLKFGIDMPDLDSLIILVKKMVFIDKLKGKNESTYVDNKICWSYTNDSTYTDNKEKQFLISLIKKLLEYKDISQFIIKLEGIDAEISLFFNKNIIQNLSDLLRQAIESSDKTDEKLKEKLIKLKPILEELNKLCNANKFITEYEKKMPYNLNEVNQILATVEEKVNLSYTTMITALSRRRESRSLKWDSLFTNQTRPTREKLNYFEDLLNYNECIKLIKAPKFFDVKQQQEYNYNRNPNLLQNSEMLKNAIKNLSYDLSGLNNEIIKVKHLPSEEVSSNTYKLQKLLEYILEIILEVKKSGGTKRRLDLEGTNYMPKTKKFIISDYSIFIIASFIENSIDIFINETEEHVNLYLYCDFEYIGREVIRIFNVFGSKYVDIINQLIIKKIKLYLDEKNIYKNEEYGFHLCNGVTKVSKFFEEKINTLLQNINEYIKDTSKSKTKDEMNKAFSIVELLVDSTNEKDDLADILTNKRYASLIRDVPKPARQETSTSIMSYDVGDGKLFRILHKDKHSKKKSKKKRKPKKKKRPTKTIRPTKTRRPTKTIRPTKTRRQTKKIKLELN